MVNAERIQDLKWLYERQLAWIAAADVKVGVIVAVQTALVGALAAAFTSSSPEERTAWVYLWSVLSGSSSAIAVLCAAMATFPTTTGPARSLIFFARICDVAPADYADRLKQATDEDLADDLCAQIHRNAEIAKDKYVWVSKAMAWSFGGALPWAIAIAMLVKN
jgi:hypothetical protein